MIQTIQTAAHAIVDLSLLLSSINNHSSDYTQCYQFQISFLSQNSQIYAFPYQSISHEQNQKSSVTLESYKSQKFLVPPKKRLLINEMCVFRLMISLQQALHGSLICFVKLLYQEQVVREQLINFNCILGISTYLPLFFPFQSISINCSVESQLLGIKCKKNGILPRSSFYSIIDSLFWEHVRLNKKMKEMINNKNEDYIQESIMLEEKTSIVTYQNPSLSEFPEHNNIQLNQYHSIFHRNHTKDIEKISNLELFCYQASNHIQIQWKNYLSEKIKHHFENIHEKQKKKYYEQLLYEFNKMPKLNIDEDNKFQVIVQQLKMDIDFTVLNKQILYQEKSVQKNLNQLQLKSAHLVVLVHGLGANSYAFSLYQKYINYFYPHVNILISRANENYTHVRSLQEMGKSLATQIQLYLHNKKVEDLQISFIAHSLGGLIVRAALFHLQSYKFNMQTFISLSCPHLGHLKHSNKMTKMGMIAANKLWHSSVFDSLLFKDSRQVRDCYLYNLAFHSGLHWFQNIQLYGCVNDGIVSSNSALFNLSLKQGKQSNSEKALRQMKTFFQQSVGGTKIDKIHIQFEQNDKEEKLYQRIIGRGPHLEFLINKTFITYVLLQISRVFKQNDEKQQYKQ